MKWIISKGAHPEGRYTVRPGTHVVTILYVSIGGTAGKTNSDPYGVPQRSSRGWFISTWVNVPEPWRLPGTQVKFDHKDPKTHKAMLLSYNLYENLQGPWIKM